jgi:hypothetical protein
MPMTIRLTDAETAMLRAQAEREGRSMQDVVRLAIQDRVAQHDHRERVLDSLRRMTPRNREILDRLKDV